EDSNILVDSRFRAADRSRQCVFCPASQPARRFPLWVDCVEKLICGSANAISRRPINVLPFDRTLPERTVAKDLIVGSAGLQDFEDSIASFLSSRGLEVGLESWLDRPDTIATICCLNGASVVEFLRHVVQLEGYADENAGFAAGEDGKLKGKNFPWWDN